MKEEILMLIRTIGWYLLIGWTCWGLTIFYERIFHKKKYDKIIERINCMFDELKQYDGISVLIGIVGLNTMWPVIFVAFAIGELSSITSKSNDKQP